MTRSQAEIIEQIAALPESDRQALVKHLVESHLGGESLLDRMTPEQRAALDAGIAEAEQGNLISAEQVFERISSRRVK